MHIWNIANECQGTLLYAKKFWMEENKICHFELHFELYYKQNTMVGQSRWQYMTNSNFKMEKKGYTWVDWGL